MNIEQKAAEMRKYTEMLVSMHNMQGNHELAKEWKDTLTTRTPEEMAALYDNIQSGEAFKAFAPEELDKVDDLISKHIDRQDKPS